MKPASWDNRVVSPSEFDFLRRVQKSAPCRLAGGAASSGVHLRHRLSRDLDLFCEDRDSVSPSSGGWPNANPTILSPANTYLDNCYDVYIGFDNNWLGRFMYHGGIGWHTSGSTTNHCACGNSSCKSPENATNCPRDCGCGNGTCQSATENSSNCPVDCGGCGNGTCQPPSETPFSCPSDC